MMESPPNWTDGELEADRFVAVRRFRHERLREPLEDYVGQLDHFAEVVDALLAATEDLRSLEANAHRVFAQPDRFAAFRYLGAPPISEDDLKAVADVKSVTERRLRDRPADLASLVDTISTILDPRRFPWVSEGRAPTQPERRAAVLATASLIAQQRVATSRRNQGKADQEAAVRRCLLDAGLREVAARSVKVISQAPEPGAFCGEAMLGTRKADFLVRLHDERIMPIECKVSNSYTNSIKRLNNDAAAKAVVWRGDFGRTLIVPAAVLSGLFKLHKLREAQARGLALFWAHSLDKLSAWVVSATPRARSATSCVT